MDLSRWEVSTQRVMTRHRAEGGLGFGHFVLEFDRVGFEDGEGFDLKQVNCSRMLLSLVLSGGE